MLYFWTFLDRPSEWRARCSCHATVPASLYVFHTQLFSHLVVLPSIRRLCDPSKGFKSGTHFTFFHIIVCVRYTTSETVRGNREVSPFPAGSPLPLARESQRQLWSVSLSLCIQYTKHMTSPEFDRVLLFVYIVCVCVFRRIAPSSALPLLFDNRRGGRRTPVRKRDARSISSSSRPSWEPVVASTRDRTLCFV